MKAMVASVGPEGTPDRMYSVGASAGSDISSRVLPCEARLRIQAIYICSVSVMSPPLVFYFDFLSPYAYVAWNTIPKILGKHVCEGGGSGILASSQVPFPHCWCTTCQANAVAAIAIMSCAAGVCLHGGAPSPVCWAAECTWAAGTVGDPQQVRAQGQELSLVVHVFLNPWTSTSRLLCLLWVPWVFVQAGPHVSGDVQEATLLPRRGTWAPAHFVLRVGGTPITHKADRRPSASA